MRLLKPTITKRSIDGLEIYSFFNYRNIEDLLLTKHTTQGFRVYNALARVSFAPFIKTFMKEQGGRIDILGIDEDVKSGYSHVALLTHSMKSKNVRVFHAQLMAQNSVKYAGKSLQFRRENPRGFHYRGLKGIEVILVDDIVTTGITLTEARDVLKKNGVEVLFALTLATL